MKPRTKKILAREFLFLLGTTILGLITFFISDELLSYYSDEQTAIEVKYENLVISKLLENMSDLEGLYDFKIQLPPPTKEEFDLLETEKTTLNPFTLMYNGDAIETIINDFTINLESISVDYNGIVRSPIDKELEIEFPFLTSGPHKLNFNSIEKVKYVKSRFYESAKSIDDYYWDKIKRDLSKDLKFIRINNQIESKYSNIVSSKRNELRRKVFNGEISRGESKDVLLKLIDEADVRIAKEKSGNDYLNQKYIEAINQYKDEWENSRNSLSDKVKSIGGKVVDKIGGNANDILQLQKRLKRTEGTKELLYGITGRYDLILYLFLLFFLFRYLIYATQWSIAQLRKKDLLKI